MSLHAIRYTVGKPRYARKRSKRCWRASHITGDAGGFLFLQKATCDCIGSVPDGGFFDDIAGLGRFCLPAIA